LRFLVFVVVAIGVRVVDDDDELRRLQRDIFSVQTDAVLGFHRGAAGTAGGRVVAAGVRADFGSGDVMVVQLAP
jgi:hypothetical protein